MQLMSESIKQKSQIEILESHMCGLMVVCTFFGEHFKFIGVPIYCYPLFLCILMMLVNNNFKLKKVRRINFSRVETFPFLLIIFSTITLPFSIRIVGTQPYFKTVVTALIMLVVAKNIYNEESFEQILEYALIGIIITAAACGYELLTGHHFYAKVLIDERLYRMGRNNSFGFQINVNDNASLIALSIFIAVLYLRNKGIIKKVLIATLALILFLIMTAINSRLVLLAFMVVGIEAIVLLLISRYTKGTVPKFVVSLLFALLCILYFSSFTITGFLNTFSSSAYYNQDLDRILFMQWSLKTISPISLLFGNGCGVTQQLIGGSSIHAVIVEFLCDNGIIVILCFMNLIIKMLLSFADNIKLRIGVLLSCFATAFIFISFCSSSMLRIRSIWVYFVVFWKLYSLHFSQSDFGSGNIKD